jgi:trehalose 6-phosphate phosphatase
MNDILEKVTPGTPVILFCDYDGTLVPIRKTPAEAILRPSRRRFLARLAERVCVVIVSGRSVRDVRAHVGIDGIAYVGDHGLEISSPGWRWVHAGAKKARPALVAALGRISRRQRDFPGMLVEWKGFTGSVHYRLLAPRLRDDLRAIVEREARASGGALKLTEGKMVFEFRPNLDWDKGKAVVKLARRLGGGRRAIRVYIGDDRTDEDAFRELGPEAVTIFVGARKRTRAKHRLADVPAVWEFLRALGRRSVGQRMITCRTRDRHLFEEGR